MKYMIMMFGEASSMVATQTPEWIEQMMAFMFTIDDDLTASGELVFQAGLADGYTAKTLRLEHGAVVTTDGPFAESKESIIGFWVVDVASEARALEITASIVEVTGGPIEVRLSPDGPSGPAEPPE